MNCQQFWHWIETRNHSLLEMKEVKAIIWIRRLIRKFLTINTSHSATGKVATELVFHTNVMMRIYEKVQILEENEFD